MNELFVKRLKAINIMLLMCASNCAIYGGVLLFLDIKELAFIIFGFSIAFFFLIFLQFKQQTNIVRAVLLLFLNLFIFFFSIVINKEAEIELLFSLLMILPLVFYQYSEFKHWIVFPILSVCLAVTSIYLPGYNIINLDVSQLTIVKSMVWFTLFLWVVVLFYWVHSEYSKTETELTLKNTHLSNLLKAYQKNEEELIRLNKLTTERYQELEHIIQIVSHDLKEPVQALVTGSQFLEAKDLDAEARVQIQTSMFAARDELFHMYTGVRRFSSVGTSSEFCDISINAVLNDIVENYKESKRLKIIAPNLPSTTANYNDITRLFEELISNSVRYNRHEEVVVNIQVNHARDNKTFTLDYSDNSIGFSTIDDNVFKLFFRQKINLKSNKRGVGLAIVKKIVNFYNGKIILKNSTNGVRYLITLPIYKNHD